MKTVFVNSSVLFSAVNSPTGGSAKLFITKGLRLVTSKVVATEVERNVRKKLALLPSGTDDAPHESTHDPSAVSQR